MAEYFSRLDIISSPEQNSALTSALELPRMAARGFLMAFRAADSIDPQRARTIDLINDDYPRFLIPSIVVGQRHDEEVAEIAIPSSTDWDLWIECDQSQDLDPTFSLNKLLLPKGYRNRDTRDKDIILREDDAYYSLIARILIGNDLTKYSSEDYEVGVSISLPIDTSTTHSTKLPDSINATIEFDQWI